MSKTIKKRDGGSGALRFIVSDAGRRFRERLGNDFTFWIRSSDTLQRALSQASEDCVWIVMQPHWTERLVGAASHYAQNQGRQEVLGDLLLLSPPSRNDLLPSLHTYFRRVVGEVSSFRMLPHDQLAEVLSSENRAELFIGGIVDESTRTLTLARGNLRMLTVPLSIFHTDALPKPDFAHFLLDDYGYALRFGDYEASAHYVFYAVDAEYRCRFNKKRKAEERGFGPSLQRLRVLRRLSRRDFPGISSKTIARIERGETERPHGNTLDILAETLGVAPEEVETY